MVASHPVKKSALAAKGFPVMRSTFWVVGGRLVPITQKSQYGHPRYIWRLVIAAYSTTAVKLTKDDNPMP